MFRVSMNVWNSSGPTKHPVFSSFDTDGSTVVDGHVEEGIRYQDSVRRQHLTIRDNQVLASSVATERRAEAPQPCANFGRAASDQQTRIGISSWNPGPKRGTPGAIEVHIARRAHRCPTRICGIPSSSGRHEAVLRDPPSWMRRLVQQAHLRA